LPAALCAFRCFSTLLVFGQIVYVWESPADDIIEEAASFSMIREEDYKVASVWLAFNGPPFPES